LSRKETGRRFGLSVEDRKQGLLAGRVLQAP